jgi:hypothetical protein
LTYTLVSVGATLACGLLSDGNLTCWGYNGSGELDVLPLPGGLTYTQVNSGWSHACGLRSDGSLVCWGANGLGQTDVLALPTGLAYTQVAGGGDFTCALRSDSSLVCWGNAADGKTTVPPAPGSGWGEDSVSPAVSSIGVPGSAGVFVDFTITFTEYVVGVDPSDFTTTVTGSLSGQGIARVSGSGAVYTVKVDTGVGSGTLKVNLVDDDSIRDAVDKPLGGSGAGNGSLASGALSYTIYKVYLPFSVP